MTVSYPPESEVSAAPPLRPESPGRPRIGQSRPAGSSRERSSQPFAIESDGLTKRFRGGQVAVDHVALRVPAGSVYGFLGPNGSGKTTTIRMLLGLIFPTAGTHRLLGEPFADNAAGVLPRVGSLVEGPAFHPYLSGSANLARLDAADRSVDPRTARHRIGSALERVGLSAAAGKRYRNYSLGMRQRLGIAAALLGDPGVLLLDEPVNGLDPEGIRWIRELMKSLAAEGRIVFVSSHLISEMALTADRLIVIGAGRLLADTTVAELSARSASLEDAFFALTAASVEFRAPGPRP